MTGMTSRDRFNDLLFDLGGVLLQTRCLKDTFGLDIDTDTYLREWIRSPSVRACERGETDDTSFAKSIVSEAALPYDWQEFLVRFDSWPERLDPGVRRLVNPHLYHVSLTPALWDLKQDLVASARAG